MPDIQNAHDYEQYKAAVARFLHDEGLSHVSTGTANLSAGEDPESSDQEPWYSRYPCECCKSPLAGSREYLYGHNSNDELEQFQICEDCVYYINYGRLDDQTMERVEASKGKTMNAALTASLIKQARILTDDEEVNSDAVLQALVGDPEDSRISTFVQFKPSPGTMQMPNPLSPIEGDEIFFAYMIPGSRFQAHDGSQWMIQDYTGPDNVEIYNLWYPALQAIVSVNDVRRSIHQWINPITQTVPPPPPGVDYSALPVKIVDGPERIGNADENTDYKTLAASGW